MSAKEITLAKSIRVTNKSTQLFDGRNISVRIFQQLFAVYSLIYFSSDVLCLTNVTMSNTNKDLVYKWIGFTKQIHFLIKEEFQNINMRSCRLQIIRFLMKLQSIYIKLNA